MRRFLAYILASATIFIGVGISFKPIATRINPDLNYRDGKKITFKLSDREDGTKHLDFDTKAASDYAALIETRLKNYGTTDYHIEISGNDTIAVTLTANNDEEYNNISKIIRVNSKIELATTKDNTCNVVEGEGFSWHENKAYITYDNNTSILVLPIPNAAKSKVDELIKKAKEDEGDKPKDSTNEGEDKKPSIAMWINRIDESYADKDKPEYPLIKEKIIREFRTDNFYYGTDNNAIQFRFEPNSSSTVDVRSAYNKAVYHMNILNASLTDYDCEEIRNEIAPATIENLIIYGARLNIAMSYTFISMIIAFIIISIILVFIYRLNGIGIMATSTLFTFVVFSIFVAFHPVFNITAIVGLIITALASLFIGVAYNHYFREEVYKGRSLKKANYEASKKTTLLTVDSSIILAIAGLLTYFIGGTTVHSLGIVLIIASVINLLINTFVLKGLMWLITNTTSFQNKYYLYNIKAKEVPNLAKEEKPRYFGPHMKLNIDKYSKFSAITLASVLLISITALITLSATTKSFFNSGNYFAPKNQITFNISKSEGSSNPIPSLKLFDENYLSKITNSLNGNKTFAHDSNIDEFNYKHYDVEQKIYKTVFVYTIKVNETDVTSPIYKIEGSSLSYSLEEANNIVIQSYLGSSAIVNLKETKSYNLPSDAGLILIASLVATFVSSIYLWIRYRASRALTLFLIAGSSEVVSISIMAITRLTAIPIMGIASSIAMVFTMFMGLYILNKDKDLIRNERIRDVSKRKEVLYKANKMALSAILCFFTLGGYLLVNFLGFGVTNYALIFLSSGIASLLSLFLFFYFFSPFASFIDEKFMRIKLPEIKIHKKKVVTKKSNEPEEATFIGIND